MSEIGKKEGLGASARGGDNRHCGYRVRAALLTSQPAAPARQSGTGSYSGERQRSTCGNAVPRGSSPQHHERRGASLTASNGKTSLAFIE